MIAQIKMRRGTTAEWAEASPVVLAVGEPGWDSTLKGMKVGDGSTEWAALPWIDAKNRPDINAATLDGVHLADIRLGQNILHNADFRNPINQRGASGEISGGTYFFDRWIRNSGTVNVNVGYLTMASGAVIEQRIEGLYLAGETVTVSVKVGSNIYSGTGAFPTAAGTVGITLSGFGAATLGYNAGYMFVRFTASGSQNVIAVKGELGTVSTLHLDPPMDHAVELPKCQRYFINLGGFVPFVGSSPVADEAEFLLHAPNMRTNPSISTTALSVIYGGVTYPGNVHGLTARNGYVKVNSSGHTGLPALQAFSGSFANDNISLSADL